MATVTPASLQSDQWLISRTGTLIEAGVGDELFALDVEGGHCFGFNATAAQIWRLLEQPMTLAALCDALAAEYAIDRATCEAEVSALLRSLADEKLVTLSPQ